MFCPQCGNQLPDGSAFCSNCGSQLTQQTPVEQPIPRYEQPIPQYEIPRRINRHRRKLRLNP